MNDEIYEEIKELHRTIRIVLCTNTLLIGFIFGMIVATIAG